MSTIEPLCISQLLDGYAGQYDSNVRKENIPFFKNIFDFLQKMIFFNIKNIKLNRFVLTLEI